MPHICHVAAACARGRGSGAIIAEPSQRSLSRERKKCESKRAFITEPGVRKL
jgi:hypothetical protein